MRRIREHNPNTEKYWNDNKRLWLETGWNYFPGDLPYEICKHLRHGDRVLDVGTGSGMVMRWVKKLRPNLYYECCDRSVAAVDWLRKKNSDGEFAVNGIFQSDISMWDCKVVSKHIGNEWDVLLSTEVIEHVDDPQKFVNALITYASRSVIISTPHGGAVNSTEHVWEFTLDDIYSLLSPHGMVYLTVVRGGTTILAVCEKS